MNDHDEDDEAGCLACAGFHTRHTCPEPSHAEHFVQNPVRVIARYEVRICAPCMVRRCWECRHPHRCDCDLPHHRNEALAGRLWT